MTNLRPAVLLTLVLAGCGRQPSSAAADPPAGPATVPVEASRPAPAATPTTDAWTGRRWIGVEGLALDVAKTATPGTYDLTVSLMDGTGHYVGHADGDTIRFTRDGIEETIRHGTGKDTGLKWLDGKTDCLVIKPGEGFCRG